MDALLEGPYNFSMGKVNRLGTWALNFIGLAALILLVRLMLWSRVPELKASLLSFPRICVGDLLLAALGSALIVQLPKKWHRVSGIFLLGLFLFVPVFFQIKMGLPLSWGLLAQVGGVFMLKTSVTDQSQLRNLWSVLLVMGSFMTYLVVAARFEERLLRFKLPLLALAIALLALPQALRLGRTSLEKSYAYSFLLELTTPSSRDAKLTELLGPLEGDLLARVSVPKGPQQRNLIFIVLETFDYSLVKDPDHFARVMPFLGLESKRARRYDQHFAPWPFSSKAQFSIFCGSYPYPGSIIEIRVKPDSPCESWAKALAGSGFDLWLGYSGDLAYDRMGDFYRAQAPFTLEERKKLERMKLASWDLGVDDRALLLAFDEWLEKRSTDRPFAATFVPLNSHHPYWTPPHFTSDLRDPYERSFAYQDQLLKELFAKLQARSLLANTVIVITGDHGRREGAAVTADYLPESMYHVPLFVFEPGAAPATITHGTSHLDLAGSILKLTGAGGSHLQDLTLDAPKDFLLLYDFEHYSFIIKTKDQRSVFVNTDQQRPTKKEDLAVLKSHLLHARKTHEALH